MNSKLSLGKPNFFYRVTTFSKALTLMLFVALPIVAFYFGIYYQKSTASPTESGLKKTISNSLNLVTPEGWTISSDSDNSYVLDKKILNDKYRFGFQLNDSDFFYKGGPYNQGLTKITTIVTQKKSKIYLIRDNSYIYLSACEPIKNEACSISYNNRYLFGMLYMYKEGDQYPRDLNFQDRKTDTAISEIIEMISKTRL